MKKLDVFIGDIHGDVDFLNQVIAHFGTDVNTVHYYSVGDLIDSRTRTVTEQVACMKRVLELQQAGLLDWVIGNHELSYMFPNECRCSGYNDSMANSFQSMMFLYKIINSAKPWLLLHDKILLTHAGLSNKLFKRYEDVFLGQADGDLEQGLNLISGMTLDEPIENWKRLVASPLNVVGPYRGGYHQFGGIFWSDYHHEFELVTGLLQIFGHTPCGNIDFTGDVSSRSYCINNIGGQVLTYDPSNDLFNVVTI